MKPVPLKYGKLAKNIRGYTDIFLQSTCICAGGKKGICNLNINIWSSIDFLYRLYALNILQMTREIKKLLLKLVLNKFSFRDRCHETDVK